MSLPPNLTTLIESAHQQHQTIVFVSGVFDLLHEEHQKFLTKAAQQGDVLIVGLESDMRVKQLKGEGRPIWNQEKRKQAIGSLPGVTMAFILPENFNSPADHEALIRAIRPNILAVSSHSEHLDAKQRIMSLVGGKVVVVHQHNPQVSTTQILNKKTN